jgi:hypothetical protein
MRTVVTWCMLFVAIPLFGYAILALFTGLPHGGAVFVLGLVLSVWGLIRDTKDHRHPMTRAQRARGYFWGNQ